MLELDGVAPLIVDPAQTYRGFDTFIYPEIQISIVKKCTCTLLITDPFHANSTTIHRRMVRQDIKGDLDWRLV